MSAANGKQENYESEDNFRYEDVSLEDNCSLTEGDENFEAIVKAIKDVAASRANTTSSSHKPEAVDEFLRSFLFQMDMTETYDCFQTEWTEMVQKGIVDTEQVGIIPEVYIENMRLERALKNAQREREEYRQAGIDAADALQRAQRARDVHRMQHKRVIQEKNKLIEETRKLKAQCNSYEPEVKRMNGKYKAVLKQTMLVSLERDKVKSAQHSSHHSRGSGEERAVKTAGVTSVRGVTHQVIQPRPPSSAKPQGSSPRRSNI